MGIRSFERSTTVLNHPPTSFQHNAGKGKFLLSYSYLIHRSSSSQVRSLHARVRLCVHMGTGYLFTHIPRTQRVQPQPSASHTPKAAYHGLSTAMSRRSTCPTESHARSHTHDVQHGPTATTSHERRPTWPNSQHVTRATSIQHGPTAAKSQALRPTQPPLHFVGTRAASNTTQSLPTAMGTGHLPTNTMCPTLPHARRLQCHTYGTRTTMHAPWSQGTCLCQSYATRPLHTQLLLRT
jgi:hypothetical protein